LSRPVFAAARCLRAQRLARRSASIRRAQRERVNATGSVGDVVRCHEYVSFHARPAAGTVRPPACSRRRACRHRRASCMKCSREIRSEVSTRRSDEGVDPWRRQYARPAAMAEGHALPHCFLPHCRENRAAPAPPPTPQPRPKTSERESLRLSECRVRARARCRAAGTPNAIRGIFAAARDSEDSMPRKHSPFSTMPRFDEFVTPVTMIHHVRSPSSSTPRRLLTPKPLYPHADSEYSEICQY